MLKVVKAPRKRSQPATEARNLPGVWIEVKLPNGRVTGMWSQWANKRELG
jgi:hypothetical protein